MKPDSSIRICVDMRMANTAVIRERFILPTIDEVLQQLQGSSIFSKLDMSLAFSQIELSPESREITNFMALDNVYWYK